MKVAGLTVLACAGGCSHIYNGASASFGYLGIVGGNLKMPVVVPMSSIKPVNGPLDAEVFEEVAELPLDRGGARACEATESSAPFSGSRRRADCVDTFPEFDRNMARPSPDTLVVVAISGGGTRAAMLGAHVMAMLERRYSKLFGSFPPMLDRIDAFSTVSGGSLYAYHVARRLSDLAQPHAADEIAALGVALHCGLSAAASVASDPNQHDPTGCTPPRQTFFRDTETDGRAQLGYQQPGSLAFQSSLGTYGIGLVTSLLTDWSYTHHLAKSLEFSRRPFTLLSPVPFAPLSFAEVPIRPRFYFNTTALETGSPIVLTQRVTNLPPESPTQRPSRLDLIVDSCDGPEDCRLSRPLHSSLTLEELGSSPATFGVAYAAAASAAFPFATQPLPLLTYQYRPSLHAFTRTENRLSLVDGGVFDNSGTTTAVDLFEYLAKRPSKRVARLILIAINADPSRFDSELPARAARPDSTSVLALSSPIPPLFSGADSVNLIHFTNKRRSEDASWERLQRLMPRLKQNRTLNARERETGVIPPEILEFYPKLEQGELRKLGDPDRYRRFREKQAMQTDKQRVDEMRRYVHYFPINLAQLSALDPSAIPGGQSYYDRASEVGTSFWSRWGDDAVIEAAARKLVTAEQNSGWFVGPSCADPSKPRDAPKPMELKRLDDAIAFAIARSQQPHWDDPLPGVDAARWCNEGSRSFGDATTW